MAWPRSRRDFRSGAVAPRLWIDLTIAVVMETNPKIYRLVEDTHGPREILFESADLANMVDRMKQRMARNLIRRFRDTGPASFALDGWQTSPK